MLDIFPELAPQQSQTTEMATSEKVRNTLKYSVNLTKRQCYHQLEMKRNNPEECIESIKSSEEIRKPKDCMKKDSPKKTLAEGDDFKKLQKKAKKLGASSLDYSKRKNNKYMVEYNGKKIHFGSANTEDFIIHKDPDRRDKYRVKAMKITNKNGELTYQLPTYPNYWSVKLLN